jgi:uncharacterized protein with von Willebrand factor type A (vWA) domain
VSFRPPFLVASAACCKLSTIIVHGGDKPGTARLMDVADPGQRSGADDIVGLLLRRLGSLAARARRYGMAISVEQVAALVDALGVRPVETIPELKRIVRLTMATRGADLAVLDAVVDAEFALSFAGSGGSGDPSSAPVTTDEIRNRLRRALEHGDVAAAADSGLLAAGLSRPEWVSGAGRAGERILRALDLSELLTRALSGQWSAPELERRLAFAEAERSLQAFEDALFAELRRRQAARLADGAVPAQEWEMPAADLADLPLFGRTHAEQDQLRTAVRPLARRLASRARRRRRGGHDKLDARRTISRSVATGGVPMNLHFRTRRPRTSRLVALCDVSGSMADYSSFTLSLLEALRNELRDLRCFAFVDGAAELTGEALRQPYLLAPSLPFIPGVIGGDGHSDYESAFAAFAEVAADALTPTTALIVIGDGRTRGGGTGEGILGDLRRRVRYLYWMTPEPEADWSRGDCRLESYRRYCDRIDQVSTLGQLDRWVTRTVLGT